MNGKSLNNAFKAVAVLVLITAVCVAVLTVCNMFFPKYTPVLDAQTAKLINGDMPDGSRGRQSEVRRVYRPVKGRRLRRGYVRVQQVQQSAKSGSACRLRRAKRRMAGAYIIESQSAGRDGDVVVLIAYYGKRIAGATVKKQGESYWSKLPPDVFEVLSGKDAFSDVDLQGEFGKTGATLSLSAIERAVNIANKIRKAVRHENFDGHDRKLSDRGGASGGVRMNKSEFKRPRSAD